MKTAARNITLLYSTSFWGLFSCFGLDSKLEDESRQEGKIVQVAADFDLRK